MTAKLKICGLTDEKTVRGLDGLDVDEIGFVFAKSRRQVTQQHAGRLIGAVHELRNAIGRPPRTVGVFVNPAVKDLLTLIRVAPIDVIQLHGEESAELCNDIKQKTGKAIWKALPVFNRSAADGPGTAMEAVRPYLGIADAILIDTAGGGTGKSFDWSLVPDYMDALSQTGIPLYVAGGLHPDNVRLLLDTYFPDGVDVSSGVETDGSKDIAKIRTFVERVKQK